MLTISLVLFVIFEGDKTELPPVKELSSGHKIMCHLPDEELRAMEPVIAQGETEGPQAPDKMPRPEFSRGQHSEKKSGDTSLHDE